MQDEDSFYASTPMFTTLRTLLALQMPRPHWIARLGDVSTAFLHAPIAKDHDGTQRDVYLWPPIELCPQQDKIWRLKKAMCGLRSSPKAWQDYLAEVFSFVRLKSEHCYIMVYVDDLLVLGDKTTVDSIFEAIQKQVLLKHIGYLAGKPQQFLGRNNDHFGNYCSLGLKDSYIDNMIEESGMANCNTVTTPGIAHYKPTIEDQALLDHEKHKRYRRIVGKLQWLAYTRPDIAYSKN